MAEEWAVTTPKGQVRLGDLSLEVVVQLESDLDTEWWQIAAHPFRQARMASYVYTAACEHIGCPPAALKMRDLLDVFNTVDEDLPDVFENGIPKAEPVAEPLTPGSSGAPNDSTGHQM